MGCSEDNISYFEGSFFELNCTDLTKTCILEVEKLQRKRRYKYLSLWDVAVTYRTGLVIQTPPTPKF